MSIVKYAYHPSCCKSALCLLAISTIYNRGVILKGVVSLREAWHVQKGLAKGKTKK